MPNITSVSTLTTEALAFVNRAGDTTLQAQVPVFIDLLEGILKRKLRNKATKAALTLNAAVVALPAAVAEVRHVRHNSGTVASDFPILPRTIDQLADLRRKYQTTGKPRYYAVLDKQLHLVPAPDQSYTAEIVYTKAYTSVFNDATLIGEAPDLYLYGVLAEMAGWLEHDERKEGFEVRRDGAIEELNTQRDNEELGMINRQVLRLPRVFGERP